MAKANITSDLSLAIDAIRAFAPFTTHPDFRVWKAAILNLQGVEAILLAVEAFKPGVLRVLEAAAIEEVQVEHGEPVPEIEDLVSRYCRNREPLR